MNKLLKQLSLLILGLALILCGCSTSTDNPAASNSNSGSSNEKFELKFACSQPSVTPLVGQWEEWGAQLEELTGGRLTITVYPNQSLVNDSDLYSALLSGICDITLLNTKDVPDLVMEKIFNLPGLGMTAENALAIRKEAEKGIPAISEERANMKTLYLRCEPVENIAFTKKTARVPNDIKGMRLLVESTFLDYVEKCGASGIIVNPADVYMSLDTGVVDGISEHLGVYRVHNLLDVLKYYTIVPISNASSEVVMNLDTWNSLPSDIQQIIEETALEQEKRSEAELIGDLADVRHIIDNIPAVTVTELTEEEKTEWLEMAIPIQEEWIAEMEGKGYNAQEAFDLIKQIIAQYE